VSAAVEVRDLAVGYRTRRRATSVATGLHALARRGELTVLLGPNGSGKSTLLRTLCGLQAPLAGRVLLDGTDLTRLPPDELARRVAVVLTDRIDPGLLSARELVGLGRIPHLGFGSRLQPHDNAVVDWALAAVDADHLAARPAAELSDGERQRVLAARALAQAPGLLVLDEPTAFLDVSSRAGLVELLRGLARDQQLAIVMSTHDLELALRVADRVWLLGRDGTLVDATGEELMLSGHIGGLFDGDRLRFDPAGGVFVFSADGADGRSARVDAPEPLRVALTRVLSRENWNAGVPAEIVVTATDPESITAHTGPNATTAVTFGTLPGLLRGLPVNARRCVPEVQAMTMLTELSDVSPYFAVETGPVDHDGFRSVRQLYTDPVLLGELIGRVGERISAPSRLVAVSTFFLGFSARLWSIGLGALAGYGLVPDLAPEQLWYSESGGQIRLRLVHPMAWDGDDLESALADMVLDAHLAPLTAAVHRLGPISEKLLQGNAASAVLGAARVFDRRHGAAGPGWQLARRLCADERLESAVSFNHPGTDYRRTSCCLYYRTPEGGLCGDCALTDKPGSRKDRKNRKESS
jgi:iron complex transport system ATP-binding protein